MRTLLYAALGVLLLSPGCDLTDSDAAQPQLVSLSLTELPDSIQGEAIWEVQDTVGRVYASADDLPAVVPADAALLLVLSDAATCTPKCDALAIARLHAPADESVRIVTVDENRLGATLEFEW